MNHEPGKSLKIIICLHSAINSFPMDKIQKKGDTFFPQQQKWRKVKPEGRRSGSNRSLLGHDPPRCPKGESRNPVIIRSIVEKLHPNKNPDVLFWYLFFNGLRISHSNFTSGGPTNRGDLFTAIFHTLALEYFSEAFYCGWSVLTHPVNVKFARNLQ